MVAVTVRFQGKDYQVSNLDLNDDTAEDAIVTSVDGSDLDDLSADYGLDYSELWWNIVELAQQKAKVLALASQFRSDGEYWSGIPEHAAFQSAADRLLKTFGLSDEDRGEYEKNNNSRIRVDQGMPWELMSSEEQEELRKRILES